MYTRSSSECIPLQRHAKGRGRMPLDARKSLHLLQVVTRTFAGRQRTVMLVSLANNSYSYAPLSAILRPLAAIDPQVYNTAGQSDPHAADALLIAPLGTSFSGVVYIADTPTATIAAIAAAAKYEIVEVLPTGIVPGGTHLRVSLRRLR